MSCTIVPIPQAKGEFCSAELNFGRVNQVYLGNFGFPLTDVADAVEWGSRIDNDAAAADTVIRRLNGIGDKPAAASNVVEYSLNRKANTPADHTINFRVDDTIDANYALMQWFEENPNQTYPVWYVSGGDKMHGGNEGVAANVDMKHVIPEDDNTLQYIQVTITWTGKHPNRIPNPLA